MTFADIKVVQPLKAKVSEGKIFAFLRWIVRVRVRVPWVPEPQNLNEKKLVIFFIIFGSGTQGRVRVSRAAMEQPSPL